jgi:hypothetical protein
MPLQIKVVFLCAFIVLFSIMALITNDATKKEQAMFARAVTTAHLTLEGQPVKTANFNEMISLLHSGKSIYNYYVDLVGRLKAIGIADEDISKLERIEEVRPVLPDK